MGGATARLSGRRTADLVLPFSAAHSDFSFTDKQTIAFCTLASRNISICIFAESRICVLNGGTR